MIQVGRSRVSALDGELVCWNGHTELEVNGKKRKRYNGRLFVQPKRASPIEIGWCAGTGEASQVRKSIRPLN